MSERLTEIISHMIHTGVNARRILARGLIITYRAPDPDTPAEQARYFLMASRVGVWPDDEELKIVHDCLYKAWRKHPTALVYDTTEWLKKQGRTQQGGQLLGTYTTYWRQWPVREVFNAPANLHDTLRAALARR